MTREVTLRGGEPRVPRGMQVETKRPLVRDTMTGRERGVVLGGLGGPAVLMLLKEWCSPRCLDSTEPWEAASTRTTAEQITARAAARGPCREGLRGLCSWQEGCVKNVDSGAQESGSNPFVRQDGTQVEDVLMEVTVSLSHSREGRASTLDSPVLLEPSPPPSSSLWEPAVCQVLFQ